MALIDCYECGKEISSEASTCPSCGCPKKGYLADAFYELIIYIIVLLSVPLGIIFLFYISYPHEEPFKFLKEMGQSENIQKENRCTNPRGCVIRGLPTKMGISAD
tara:strand:+ start:420 stop:734 length:315 start_codon:yes stop_codon:yes gene_type:complete